LNSAKYHWLKKQLQKASRFRHTFIAFHHPLKFSPLAIKRRTWSSQYWRKQFISLLEKQKNLAYVFQGHNHYYDLYKSKGVKYMTCGGGAARLYLPPEKGGFFHYVIFDVKGDDVNYTVMIPNSFDVKIRKINDKTKEVIFYNNLPRHATHLPIRGIKVKMPVSRHYVLDSSNPTAKILSVKPYNRQINIVRIGFTPITGKYGNYEYERFKVKALR
jgi:hypothetical protein